MKRTDAAYLDLSEIDLPDEPVPVRAGNRIIGEAQLELTDQGVMAQVRITDEEWFKKNFNNEISIGEM